jgi:parallel beta-helix repeat protein
MHKLKTTTPLLLALLIASTFVAVATIRPAFSNPKTLYVPTLQYPTIQAAITAATSGDTIMVAGGNVYNETNLVITKDGLTLQGENRAITIIDGQNHNKPIITVNAQNVVIRGFTIRNAGTQYEAFGVNVTYSNNAYLTDNILLGNRYSIRAWRSMNITIKSSSFLGDTGGAGVYVEQCQTGDIENNTMNSNSVGAFVVNSTNFMIKNNTFFSCDYGVAISRRGGSWVVRNTFTFNNHSILLRDKGNNTVVGNSISGSKTEGLWLIESSGNMIHHNNFLHNIQQVALSGTSVNTWSTSDNIAEGNYWSDYAGTDANKNGIGDTQYYIAPGNQDPYPLIGPFTEFTVTSQTGPCDIYTISNSTITDFSFNPTAKQINFHASGADGTLGVCRVVFPKTLIDPPYAVFVNGINQTKGFSSNSTHIVLYFNYSHGSQPSNVVIVPEFPTVVIVAILLILTLLVTVLNKKTRKFSHNTLSSEFNSLQYFQQ